MNQYRSENGNGSLQNVNWNMNQMEEWNQKDVDLNQKCKMTGSMRFNCAVLFKIAQHKLILFSVILLQQTPCNLIVDLTVYDSEYRLYVVMIPSDLMQCSVTAHE